MNVLFGSIRWRSIDSQVYDDNILSDRTEKSQHGIKAIRITLSRLFASTLEYRPDPIVPLAPFIATILHSSSECVAAIKSELIKITQAMLFLQQIQSPFSVLVEATMAVEEKEQVYDDESEDSVSVSMMVYFLTFIPVRRIESKRS